MPSFGLTAFETTTGKQAELLVDNGELRVSGSSSGGVPAKAPNATESTMASVGVFGSNAAGNAFQSLKCDASGHLLVSADGGGAAPTSVTIKGNDGDNGAGTSRTIKSSANGELFVKVLGNEEADGSGTSHNLHLDGSGNTFANIVNTVFVAPANDTNSKVTDAPANSMAVGLQGRTTIGTGSTSTFLLCDANGHLAVEDKHLAILEPTIVQSETTQVQRVNLALHDVGNSNMRTAKCDTDGNLFVLPKNSNVVSGTTVQVGVSAGSGDDYQNVTIGGFDDPTNPTSFNTCQVDAAGQLQVDVVNQPNFKLEDLSSSLNADNANVTRSLATTIKGRTTADDPTTGKFLLCDSDGHLQVDIISGGGGGAGGAAGVVEGTFNTTLPTVTNGNSADLQIDSSALLLNKPQVVCKPSGVTLSENDKSNLICTTAGFLSTANSPTFDKDVAFLPGFFVASGDVTISSGVATTSIQTVNQDHFTIYEQEFTHLFQLKISTGLPTSVKVDIVESFTNFDGTNPETIIELFNDTSNTESQIGVQFTSMSKFFRIRITLSGGSSSFGVSSQSGVQSRFSLNPAATN